MSHTHYPSHPSSRRSSDPERQPRISGYSNYTQHNTPINQNDYARPQSSSSSIPSGLPDPFVHSSMPAYAPGQPYGSYIPSPAQGYYPYPQGMVGYPSATDSPEESSPPTSSGMPTFDPSQIGYPAPPMPGQDEVLALRKQVRELKLVNESARVRIHQLEHELAQDQSSILMPSSSSARPGLPSAPHTPNHSPSFEASWRARTDARVRQFCALNRAGNALCAWHETRRERRAYPPRAAPPGMLNCGCTYEEALFEESLARHDVGAYHPGENVRMDPALRNPLLRLLQTRYGYRDGDFERDPTTGAWLENEGPLVWEQRTLLGGTNRRPRGDTQ